MESDSGGPGVAVVLGNFRVLRLRGTAMWHKGFDENVAECLRIWCGAGTGDIEVEVDVDVDTYVAHERDRAYA